MIDAATQLYGILGYPLGHTLSPQMHTQAFEHVGINAVYLAFEVAPEQLPEAINGIRALRIRGANVTIPHKVTVIPHLDGLTPLAQKIGAVNTLFWEDGRLIGDNTDCQGFKSTLPEHLEGKALILGGGGAAKAVAIALEQRGCEVFSAQRTPRPLKGAQVIPFDQAATLLPEVSLLINATPVGLSNETPLGEKELALLPSGALVYDLIYRKTPLLCLAEARGLKIQDGGLMLVRQAALAFNRWTGYCIPGYFEALLNR